MRLIDVHGGIGRVAIGHQSQGVQLPQQVDVGRQVGMVGLHPIVEDRDSDAGAGVAGVPNRGDVDVLASDAVDGLKVRVADLLPRVDQVPLQRQERISRNAAGIRRRIGANICQ